jgi:hypothetical protein
MSGGSTFLEFFETSNLRHMHVQLGWPAVMREQAFSSVEKHMLRQKKEKIRDC